MTPMPATAPKSRVTRPTGRPCRRGSGGRCVQRGHRPAASARRPPRSRRGTYGQRPEVRRGPHEDDREEHERAPGPAMPAHRRPPDEHGDGAGGAADHDVLRGRPLEPQGVDEDVERVARHREHGRQQVDRAATARRRRPPRGPGRRSAPARGVSSPVTRGRLRGPVHDRVDVAVDVHVDGVGPARGQAFRRPGSPRTSSDGAGPGRPRPWSARW